MENNEPRITLYAKTLNPESYDYRVYDLREDDYNVVFIDGGRDFTDIDNKGYLEKIKKAIKEYCDYELEVYHNNSIKDFIEYYLPKKESGVAYAPCELSFIKKALDEEDDEEVIVRCLSIITGNHYVHVGLRGCSQGDYVDCYYPDNLVKQSYIDWTEAWYFGTGTEIEVDETGCGTDPDTIEGTTFYSSSWRDEDLKREIRKYCGEKPDDESVKVVLWKWDGYKPRENKYVLAEN